MIEIYKDSDLPEKRSSCAACALEHGGKFQIILNTSLDTDRRTAFFICEPCATTLSDLIGLITMKRWLQSAEA